MPGCILPAQCFVLGEGLDRQPAVMHLRPGRATGINATMPQKEGLKVLSRFSQPVVCNLICAHRIANGVMRFIRHPYRCQLVSPVQPGQAYSVASVGLDPVTRAPEYERWGPHLTTVAQTNDLAVKLVSRRTRLVAKVGRGTAFHHLVRHLVPQRQPRPRSSILRYRVRQKLRYPCPWPTLA